MLDKTPWPMHSSEAKAIEQILEAGGQVELTFVAVLEQPQQGGESE